MTKDLGAVGHLLAGQVASVLTVGGSVILLDEHLTLMQIAGFCTVLAGASVLLPLLQSKSPAGELLLKKFGIECSD